MNKILAAIALMMLAGCATPVQHNTPSGKVERTVPGQKREILKEQINDVMLTKGYSISQESQNKIAFDRPVYDHMARLLLSGPDDTLSTRVVFNFTQSPKQTRVVVDFMFVSSEKVRYVNNGQQARDFQQWIDNLRV